MVSCFERRGNRRLLSFGAFKPGNGGNVAFVDVLRLLLEAQRVSMRHLFAGGRGLRRKGKSPSDDGDFPCLQRLLAVLAALRVGRVLGGFRLFAGLRLAVAFACRGRLSAVCSGFGVFHVHSFLGTRPGSDLCLSRIVWRQEGGFIRRRPDFPRVARRKGAKTVSRRQH